MPDGATALHDFFGKEAGDFFAIPLLKASLLFSPGEPFSRQMEEWQSPIFAEKGRYASGEYIGEGRCQNLKMGLLPGAFSLIWGHRLGPLPRMMFMALFMTRS